MMPFSVEQFFQVFDTYNRYVFPFQLVLFLIALTAVFLAVKSRRDRIVSFLLGFLWLWMGAVYHLLFFSRINPAAVIFAALFIFQGVLFIRGGRSRNGLRFRVEPGRYGTAGLILVLYALVAYPILGFAHGETFPAMPTFGLPCPTTIFTFGMLLWMRKPLRLSLLIIPFFWSLIGVYAGAVFGVTEDLGLPIAGTISTSLLVYKHTSSY